jgi:DNA-binding transcriptional ArsR family regulator
MAMEAALKAIAEPRRRAILRLVAARELPAGEIASHFRVSRPAISQHLGVLKRARLLTERRAGTQRFYSARPDALAELRTFIDSMWEDSLERERVARERAGRSRARR